MTTFATIFRPACCLPWAPWALGFVTVAAIQRLQVSDSIVGFYTVALLLGQTAGSLAAGWLADRYGHKLSLEASGSGYNHWLCDCLNDPPGLLVLSNFFLPGDRNLEQLSCPVC